MSVPLHIRDSDVHEHKEFSSVDYITGHCLSFKSFKGSSGASEELEM